MLSDLYKKTKEEIKNLKDINFSDNDWQWYYENGVAKRLEKLDKPENFVIESFVHSFRAEALLKDNNNKLSQYE